MRIGVVGLLSAGVQIAEPTGVAGVDLCPQRVALGICEVIVGSDKLIEVLALHGVRADNVFPVGVDHGNLRVGIADGKDPALPELGELVDVKKQRTVSAGFIVQRDLLAESDDEIAIDRVVEVSRDVYSRIRSDAVGKGTQLVVKGAVFFRIGHGVILGVQLLRNRGKSG